jgi:hypothetical protein
MVRFPGNGGSYAVAVSAILLLVAGCGSGHGHAAGVVESASKPPSATPSATGFVKRADFLTGVACLSARTCVAVGWYYYGAARPSLTLAARWNGRAWLAEPTPSRGHGSRLDGVSCASAPCALRWALLPRHGPGPAGRS